MPNATSTSVPMSSMSVSLPFFTASSPSAALLPGAVPSVRVRYQLDLDKHVHGKPRHFHGGAGRAVPAEPAGVHLVEFAEVVHVGQVAVRLHDAAEVGAAGFQDFL